MKKVLGILLTIIMIFSMVACSKEKAAMNIILDATEKAANWENYNIQIDSYMKINDPIQGEMEIQTSGEGTIFMEPMKLHMNMDVDISSLKEVQNIEQYMIQEGDSIVLYQYVQDQWYKMEIDIEGLGDILQSDPAEDIQLMMDYTKSAEVLGEEKINGKKAYAIELAVSMKIYTKIIERNEALGSMVPLKSDENLIKLLSKMDDLKYKIWVDKTSGEIVKYSMDLGKMMEILMSKMEIEGMTSEQKDMFKDMEMTTTMTISNQNKAENFELPEEAVDAIDMGDSLE